MNVIISETHPKAYIARFHDGDFDPAFIASKDDLFAHTIRGNPVRRPYEPQFPNNTFGPLYGSDTEPVSRGVPCQSVRARLGAAPHAISPVVSSWRQIEGYQNPY